MKVRRVLLISIATAVVIVLIAVAVGLNSTFQTWAVGRVLAGRPGLQLSVGRVSAGFNSVTLTDVHYQRNGIRLVVPSIEAEFPVLSAVFFHRINLSQVEANGWRAELPAVGSLAGNAATLAEPPATGQASVPAPKTAAAPEGDQAKASTPPATEDVGFSGIFVPLKLPVDLSIGRLNTAGHVAMTGSAADLAVAVSGGGLGAGRTGKFDVTVQAELSRDSVRSVRAHGTLTAAMDTPRTFTSLALQFDATATRAAEPPVKVGGNLTAVRAAAEERYTGIITGPDRPLVVINAAYPAAAKHISGSWKLDLRDSDIAPFALGHPLPSFAAVGEGALQADARFAAVHATGRLDASVDRLTVLSPELSAIGAIKLAVEIDMAEQDDRIAVNKLRLVVGTDQPVATIESLQAFDFNPATGEVHASDAGRDLLGIEFHAVPLAWAKPFAPDVTVTGSDVHGELVAASRGGGFSFRSKTPLVVTKLSVARAGRLLLRDLDVSLNAAGDYTPRGWQAELMGATAKTGRATVMLLDAKAGRLSGTNQSVKATGLLTVNLPALFAEPVTERAVQVARGDATVDFVASFAADHSRQFQAKIAVRGLVANPNVPTQSLPAISANVRADIGVDHQLTVNLPLVLEREGRKSDLTVVGKLAPDFQSFDAQVTSSNLVLQDAQVLLALRPAASATQGATPGQARPGLNGTLALQLKKVVCSDAFELSNVTGTLRLTGGELKFDHVQAGVRDGTARGTGVLTVGPGGPQTYGVTADLAFTDFNPGPWFLATNPHQSPPVEGKCTLTTTVHATAGTLAMVPAAAIGTFELTSKSGTFRGLSVNVGNLVENSSKLKMWIASAGDAITSIARRKDYDDIPTRSQAANELAKILSAISYDQLGVVATRDAALNLAITEFTLISPEIRIKGTGHVIHRPGEPMRDDTVEMEYQLRARGRPAELMKILGVLDAKTDDLGYAACTIPVKVNGTLSRFDTTELSNKLIALAVEKSGLSLTDKAFDWINRLRGKL